MFLATDPSGFDLSQLLAQLGVSAVTVAAFGVAVRVLWNDNQSLRKEVRDVYSTQVARERELADKMGPLLGTAIDVLARAPAQFDRVLSDARESSRVTDTDRKVEELKQSVEQMLREHRRDR